MLIQTPNGQGLFANTVVYGDISHLTILTRSRSGKRCARADSRQVASTRRARPPLGVGGTLRSAVWPVVRGAGGSLRAVETSRSTKVLTENMIAVAQARRRELDAVTRTFAAYATQQHHQPRPPYATVDATLAPTMPKNGISSRLPPTDTTSAMSAAREPSHAMPRAVSQPARRRDGADRARSDREDEERRDADVVLRQHQRHEQRHGGRHGQREQERQGREARDGLGAPVALVAARAAQDDVRHAGTRQGATSDAETANPYSPSCRVERNAAITTWSKR